MYPTDWQIRKKLLLRGFLGGIGVNVAFTGIKLVPISEGTVLMRTAPIWTALMAIYVLKTEKQSLGTIISSIMSVVGITLIAQPKQVIDLLNVLGANIETSISAQNWEYHLWGVILCLTSSLLVTFVQILISSLSHSISQATILQYFSFFSLGFSVVQLLYIPGMTIKIPDFYESILLVLIGLIGMGGQYLMNRSLMYGNLTKITLVGQSQVVFTMLLDILVIQVSLNMLSIMGIIVVMLSILVEIIKKKEKK